MPEKDFRLSNYAFDLPPEQIAQFPPKERGQSRLLIVDRTKSEVTHTLFANIGEHLPKNALLVANNSKVLQARLMSTRNTGGKIEFLLLTPLPKVLENAYVHSDNWYNSEVLCLLRTGGTLNEDEQINLGENIKIKIIESASFGQKTVILSWQGCLTEIFASQGHLPLPPYIKRADTFHDRNRYQTIYASSDKIGSIAAPTAGLHFTRELQDTLAKQGYTWSELTLYVGYGTFSPVRTQNIREHQMHSEYFDISEYTAHNIVQAKTHGHPVVAIGTTTVRTLEGAFAMNGKVQAHTGWTDIFLYPSRTFNVVDALVTNFHLPHSSLLMMVAAMIGRERLLEVYAEAVSKGYRFFSYGDAMLVK